MPSASEPENPKPSDESDANSLECRRDESCDQPHKGQNQCVTKFREPNFLAGSEVHNLEFSIRRCRRRYGQAPGTCAEAFCVSECLDGNVEAATHTSHRYLVQRSILPLEGRFLKENSCCYFLGELGNSGEDSLSGRIEQSFLHRT